VNKSIHHYCLKILVLLTLLTAMLAGCASLKPSQPVAGEVVSMRQRIASGPWEIEGKMALSDGHRSGSGRLHWRKTDQGAEVSVRAPLGQGQWLLRETPSGAMLRSSTRGERVADSAAELLSAEVGWPVPWQALPYWLFGQPYSLSSWHRSALPESFEEDGWRITYSRFKNTKLGWLPHKIIATKGPYSVKVFIHRWVFPQETL